MKLTGLPLTELIAAFRSSDPTPGGGSAAALAGAIGAALLAMVGSMPKHRAASEEDVDRLQAAAARCAEASAALTTLVDNDSAAYDAVVAAYRLPRSSDDEKAARRQRIQDAMRGAAEIPLQTMRRAADALEAAPVVARFGNPNAATDVGVAVDLLAAAQRGARLNVEINLEGIDDEEYGIRLREETARLEEEGAAEASAARQLALQRG